MKTMTVREFLKSVKNDIDVGNNVTDAGVIAYCPTIEVTPDGEKRWGHVLNYKINVNDEEDYAEVICDDEDKFVGWHFKQSEATGFFWALAGYCSKRDYDLWFVEVEHE